MVWKACQISLVMHSDVNVDTYQSHSEAKYLQHPLNIYCIFVWLL